MAIVAKSVLDARRATAAAASEAAPAAADAKVMPASPNPSPIADDVSSHVAHKPKQRGHAVKDETGKFRPTGDYETGFARPPVDTQFKPGGTGGPGRPKGSISHDALLAKHLKQKREVTLGGRRQSLTTHELLVMSTVKAALEGKDKRARDYALAISERLYPRESPASGSDAPVLSASDELSMVEYEQELREQVRKELLEELRRERDDDTGDVRC